MQIIRRRSCGTGSAIDLYNLVKFASHHPLASRNKIRTPQRFLRWQVASRTIRQPIVLPYVGGTRLIISKRLVSRICG